MDEPRSLLSRLRRLDWRVWLGLTLTFSWLALGIVYLQTSVGWDKFTKLHIDTLGNFLEGAFAPLAFLWLVVGYFLQKDGLERNTEALQHQLREIQRSAEQAVIQSETIAASEVHARQETFLKIAQHVRAQLGTITGLLFISSQGADIGDGRVSQNEQGRMFSQLSMNDTEVFARRMLEVHIALGDDAKRYALFYGTEVRARHSNNLIYYFERLLARAREVDQDGLICDSLLTSAHGFVYRLAKRHQSTAPAELADGDRTGRYIVF
jgi:hypothetical protein